MITLITDQSFNLLVFKSRITVKNIFHKKLNDVLIFKPRNVTFRGQNLRISIFKNMLVGDQYVTLMQLWVKYQNQLS